MLSVNLRIDIVRGNGMDVDCSCTLLHLILLLDCRDWSLYRFYCIVKPFLQIKNRVPRHILSLAKQNRQCSHIDL